QAYRLVDLQRWAAFLDVPLNLQPRHFPTPGHEAARLIILAGQRHGSGAALQVSYAAMHGLWAQELDISDLPTLARLADGCSLPGDKLVAELAAADEAYAANTQRAIDAQVFGAPWYRYRDEPF